MEESKIEYNKEKVKWNVVHSALKPLLLMTINYAYTCIDKGFLHENAQNPKDERLKILKEVTDTKFEDMMNVCSSKVPYFEKLRDLIIAILDNDGYYLEQVYAILDHCHNLWEQRRIKVK